MILNENDSELETREKNILKILVLTVIFGFKQDKADFYLEFHFLDIVFKNK